MAMEVELKNKDTDTSRVAIVKTSADGVEHTVAAGESKSFYLHSGNELSIKETYLEKTEEKKPEEKAAEGGAAEGDAKADGEAAAGAGEEAAK